MKHLLYIFFFFLLVSCSTDHSQKVVSGEALGTTYRLVYFSDNDFPVEQGLDSIFEAINQSMSTYRENSDISRINRGESGVKVDEMFEEVFSLSQKVNRESDGYFDPTVGDLVNMYGFGPEKGLILIDTATVDSLMEYVGLNKIKISEEGQVTKDAPEIYLDFNAIAKGYTVDVIGNYLEQNGVENYLIELGGELLAAGENLEKEAPWTVGIDDPQQEEGHRTLMAAIALKDRAMATSGNYRKFRTDTLSGRKYVHTINPLTGLPEESNLLSATVLAETCALADAYATTFMAMGLQRSKDLLEKLQGVDAYLVFSDPEGVISDYMTQEFEEVVVEEF